MSTEKKELPKIKYNDHTVLDLEIKLNQPTSCLYICEMYKPEPIKMNGIGLEYTKTDDNFKEIRDNNDKTNNINNMVEEWFTEDIDNMISVENKIGGVFITLGDSSTVYRQLWIPNNRIVHIVINEYL